jgi:hypothetical protein
MARRQFRVPAMAQTGGPGLGYSVQAGTAAGEGYRLTSLAWHADGTAGGGGYHLLAPASPTLRGSGCCCTYLPCVIRDSP